MVVTVPLKPGPNFPKETGLASSEREFGEQTKKPAEINQNSGSAGNKPEGIGQRPGETNHKPGEIAQRPGTAGSKSVATGNQPEGYDNKPGTSNISNNSGGKQDAASHQNGHVCEGGSCKDIPGSSKPYQKPASANSTKIHICEGENCKSRNATNIIPTPTVPNGNSGSCSNAGCKNSNDSHSGLPDNKKGPLSPPNASASNATIASSMSMKKSNTPGQTFCFAICIAALLCWI